MPAYFPAELEVFVDQAAPELRRRRLFRREYEGATLREHLGLGRPPRRVNTKAHSVCGGQFGVGIGPWVTLYGPGRTQCL